MSFPLSYMLLLLAGSQQKEQERIAGGDPLLIEVGNSGEEKIYMRGRLKGHTFSKNIIA